MKNKIKKMAKGDFRIEQPELVLPKTPIWIQVGEGELYQGSFKIENQKDGYIRGLVYPSSFRVQCTEQGFEGNSITIHFTYDATGLQSGETENGCFTIMCNGGEYDLDYVATVEKPFVMSAHGKIQNLDDFAKLAREDFSEARRWFRKRQFYDVLRYEEKSVRNLYSNMRKWALDEQALEEFLVGTKKKERLRIAIPEKRKQFGNVFEDKKDNINITKNTWGFMPVRLSSSGDFIQLLSQEITTDDFVGNMCRVGYIIRADQLHAGNNFGRICVETPYETSYVDIVVQQKGCRRADKNDQAMLCTELLQDYMAHLSRRMDVREWAERTVSRLKMLQSEYSQLILAHVYLHAGKEEVARWNLENYNYHRFSIGKKPELSAYYLFLTALLRKDAGHTEKVIGELERLHAKHPHSWAIMCMLVKLDPKYRDAGKRFSMLEQQFAYGVCQSLFYVEAYLCVKEEVLLLRRMGEFEIQLLNFIVKHGMLNQQIAVYAAELISRQKQFDERLFRILMKIYEAYDAPEILTAICVYLIRGHKTGSYYYKWYERAIVQELRIAQLYEYFMMSVDAKRLKGALPRIVYLYFMHGNALDYEHAAVLYANILKYEPKESEVYKHYQDEMKHFAFEQLNKRSINDNLLVIYKHFLNESEMTMERRAALYDICHAYRVRAYKKGMKYVMVIDSDGEIRQHAAYMEKGAKIYLYHPDARMVWETCEGVHHIDSIPCECKRMVVDEELEALCTEQMKEQEPKKETEEISLCYDHLRTYGLQMFDAQEVFLFCARYIRKEPKEDEFMLYVCLEMIKKGFYDEAILSYLAQYYCGATANMKLIWEKAREQGIAAHALAERIISQMLYSEQVSDEEEIFCEYYAGRTYFRLKQAYLAYVSKEYVVHDRAVSDVIFAMLQKEFMNNEYLADICKAALLKYYAGKALEDDSRELLHTFFRELCEKQMIFPWYLQYPQEWLHEVVLHDKILVSHQSQKSGKVSISYQINQGEMEQLDYQTEVLIPVYDTIYVKEFVVYEGETLQYFFKEEGADGEWTGTKHTVSWNQKDVMDSCGKFTRLNAISRLNGEDKEQAMRAYQQEEVIAEQIFSID